MAVTIIYEDKAASLENAQAQGDDLWMPLRELLVALGDVQARTGDTAGARESFVAAADLAGEIGASELLARAALGFGGRFMWARSDDDRVVPLLEQAAQALGMEESPLRVMVLARLAGSLRASQASNSR